MTDTKSPADMLEALGKPFPKTAIKQRRGGGGKSLSYVETHTVINRLNSATNGDWSFHIRDVQWRNDVLMVQGELTIPGLGTRSGFGVQQVVERAGEDLVKGAASDALKKCATLFGVALELYGADYEANVPLQAPQTARNAPKPRNPNVDPSTFSDRELDAMARDQGPQHPPAEKKAWEAKSRYLHGIADHDFLHAVAEVWKFKSWADVPLNKLVELDSYLNGKADPAVQPAFDSFRKNWEEQNKKSAMKRQAELLPGTDVVPNPDRFTQ